LDEPIAFGIRKCPYCSEVTPDYRIDCLSCGEIIPEFRDIIPKDKNDASPESQIEETDLKPGTS
jgi:hypothetical protein